MSDVLNRSLSKKSEWFEGVLIGLLALLVPTFLAKLISLLFDSTGIIAGNSQLIVGSVVNVLLIIAALKLKGWMKIVGVVTMPSISTILSGYVFKSASVFMVYMIPAIWIGNFALIYMIKLLFIKKERSYFLASIVGIVLKVSVIFGVFSILNMCHIFPEKIALALKTAMSVTQLTTASIGMVLVYLICIFKYKFKR